MRYNKIIKLANYFKLNGDVNTYFNLLKLASADKFLSMVLGSYPSRNKGSENEMPMRRKIVSKMIGNSSATIKELAETINNSDPKIRAEDHAAIWRGYLTDEQIAGLLNLLSVISETESAPMGDQSSGFDGFRDATGDLSLQSLYEKLSKIKRYHDSIVRAINDLMTNTYRIPRSGGGTTAGKITNYNYVTKMANTWFGRDERGWDFTKEISLQELLDYNRVPDTDPLSWLNHNLALFSIERSSGGKYDNCILQKLSMESDGRIICRFGFYVDSGAVASKEVVIDGNNIDSFISINSELLSIF
jgi:hypothetical protein